MRNSVGSSIKRLSAHSCVKWWPEPSLTAPSVGSQNACMSDGLDAGTVFGPVHDAEETLNTAGFVSILVPVPRSCLSDAQKAHLPNLVWINIYKNANVRGEPAHVHWCEPVPSHVQSILSFVCEAFHWIWGLLRLFEKLCRPITITRMDRCPLELAKLGQLRCRDRACLLSLADPTRQQLLIFFLVCLWVI